jgi:hypothetical protein
MRAVVFGLGKTGTTALFFKLKQAMAGDTHCLFEPRTFVPPPVSTSSVLAKVLLGYNRDVDPTGFFSFDRKLLLTRDPRDTLVSRVLYDIYNEPAICADDRNVERFVSLVRRKEADPRGTSLKAIIDLFDGMARRAMLPRATRDAGVALDFQCRHTDLFRYPYEDLVRSEYSRLEAHLGFSVSSGTAAVPPEFMRIVRTKQAGNWRHWLTAADVDYFRPRYAPYIEANGYSDDWTLAREPVIPREHASDYVMRLVIERRGVGL